MFKDFKYWFGFWGGAGPSGQEGPGVEGPERFCQKCGAEISHQDIKSLLHSSVESDLLHVYESWTLTSLDGFYSRTLEQGST